MKMQIKAKGTKWKRALRTLAATIGCVVLTVLLSACSTSADSASDQELFEVDFVLDFTPNTNHTGIYVAEALGYYEDAGLAVRIVQPPEDGADALVASGNAQFGMTYQDTMANYLGSPDPLPVTAIAAVIQHNTSGIISTERSDVHSAADMEGKRYATWMQDVEQAMVRSIVETDGGDFDQVELIPTGMTDEVSGFKADLFDCVWGYEGWGYQNAILSDIPVTYFSFIDIDDTFDYYTPVIIANDGFIAEHPEQVAAFLEATERGYLHACENPDEAASILLEAVPELDPELVLASQRYLADQYVADAPRWGLIDADRWNAFYAWMNDQGLTEVAIPLDTGFTNDHLAGK